MWKHSQKKLKGSLEKRAILIEISCYVEIYQAAKNSGDHF